MDCPLIELAPNQDDLTEPFIKHFGKKIFIPVHAINNLDKEEVCCLPIIIKSNNYINYFNIKICLQVVSMMFSSSIVPRPS